MSRMIAQSTSLSAVSKTGPKLGHYPPRKPPESGHDLISPRTSGLFESHWAAIVADVGTVRLHTAASMPW